MKKIFLALLLTAVFAVSAFGADGPVRMKLDADTAKRMSVFISNFTELDMYDIPDVSEMTEDELVYFGTGHTFLNNTKQVKKTGGQLSVPSKAVSDAVKKYFGSAIESFSSSVYRYEGNSYEYAKGNIVFGVPKERDIYYARVDTAYKDGGLIIMTGDVYNLKKPADVRGPFYAYAKPYRHNGQNTWALLSLRDGPLPAKGAAAPAAETPEPARTTKTQMKDVAGLYCVVDKELPILERPLSPLPEVDYLGDLEGIEGLIVYGNHVELNPITDASLKKYSDAWFVLTSPYEGDILGYVPKKGVEPVPKHERSDVKYFMAGRDGPELTLQPDGGGKHAVSDYVISPSYGNSSGYSLAMGEVVKSVGSWGEGGERWLLLEFETDHRGGSGGIGARYAWSPAGNFTDLSAHEPDNSRADENLIPRKMRYNAGPWTTGDAYDASFYDGKPNEKKGEFLDFLPVSEKLRRSISDRGFEIGAARGIGVSIFVDDMADYYASTQQYQADFITTDIFLHAFHLIFDHALQKFERTYLAPALEKGLKSALKTLGETEGEIYDTARDMLAIPLALLEEKPGLATKLSDRAAEEVKRAIAADYAGQSPVTGGNLDYTLFKPRGHYTLRPELERYFRAMSWLGSAELALFDDGGDPEPRNLGAAALISLALDKEGASWSDFEAPVNFLVGAPNTGGSELFRALAKKHIGSLPEASGKLSGQSAIAAFAEDIRDSVPAPIIQSTPGAERTEEEAASRRPVFRISSKRFTYDAYVFNMLTSPRVGDDEHTRNLPEGTDVMAVLGSEAAGSLADKNNGVKNYAENMKKLKAGADKYLADDGTVYSAWIAALRSGFSHSGSDQFFYNSPAWQWKKLSTQSASWAELKHDTILYADQSGAEMGGGGEYSADPFAPPYPRGYVEPDPQAFGALLEATAKLADFIKKYGMEPKDEDYQTEGRSYTDKLEEFTELLTIARDIAKKEVEGADVTIDDYVSIKQLTWSFNSGLLLPGERARDGEQLKMALVADVASDYFEGRVLEAASGKPQRIYVYVNDASGGARITRGYIFSYYEFVRSLAEGRMTDEEWKKIVYDDSRADELKKYHPAWYKELTD